MKRKIFGLLGIILFFTFIIPSYSNAKGSQNEALIIHLVDPESKETIYSFSMENYHLDVDFDLFQKDIRRWIENNKNKFYETMILDSVDNEGNIIKGKPMITLDEPLLLERILSLYLTGGKVEIPFVVTPSNYKEEEVSQLHEVTLASYTTFFNHLNSGRSTNIEISAAAIHQVIVGSGDIFSFNSIVGPRDVASGYQEAPEIVYGKTVIGIGGGVCQTSSTLFNVVDQLNVDILERHHHSKDVGYVPKGRDATVAFGGLDFQFQNTTGIPLLIKTYYYPGVITITVTTSKEYAEIFKHEL